MGKENTLSDVSKAELKAVQYQFPNGEGKHDVPEGFTEEKFEYQFPNGEGKPGMKTLLLRRWCINSLMGKENSCFVPEGSVVYGYQFPNGEGKLFLSYALVFIGIRYQFPNGEGKLRQLG